MNKFQYKERDHALELLTNGFTSKYILTELKIIAKFYNEQGHDEIDIKLLLEEFCKKYLKGYNKAVHFRIINNAAAYGTQEKNKLIQIDNIPISSNELACIDSYDIPHEYKRVLFTLLTLTKLTKEYIRIKDGEIKSNEYYFGGHKNYRELVSTSKITFKTNKKSNVKNIHDLIHILDEKGIVKITGNGNIKLLFMYDIEINDSPTITVKKYGSIGFYYDLHRGENRIKECESCSDFVKMTGNKTKYCKDCAKEKKHKKITEINKKNRLKRRSQSEE